MLITRRRWIQPSFFTSEDVLALPLAARLTFVGLWLYADDYGRERTHAALIKAAVWPVDDAITVETVEEHLLLLAEQGLIELYRVDGRDYFALTGWERQQPVHNPSRSNIPPPPPAVVTGPTSAALASPYRAPTEGLASEGGERDEGEGERAGAGVGEGAPATAAPPSPFCSRHPSGTSKACKPCGNARLAFQQWRALQQAADDDDQHEYDTEGDTP